MTDGSTWIIHRPPSNWNCSAYGTGTKMMNTSAPTFTTREAILATLNSWAFVACGARKPL